MAERFGGGTDHLLLPGGPRLYVLHGDTATSSLSIRRRTFAPLPAIGFIGPTTALGHLDTGGAMLTGVRLRSTAWATLFGGDLSRHADKVVPLTTLDHAAEALRHADAAAIETWLSTRLEDAAASDVLLEHFIATIDAHPRATVADLAATLHLTPQQLTALSLEHFGVAPKRLLSQRRFVRVLRRLLADPAYAGRALWEAGYVDRSHFAKDCRKFLGSSLQTFRERAAPLARDPSAARREPCAERGDEAEPDVVHGVHRDRLAVRRPFGTLQPEQRPGDPVRRDIEGQTEAEPADRP